MGTPRVPSTCGEADRTVPADGRHRDALWSPLTALALRAIVTTATCMAALTSADAAPETTLVGAPDGLVSRSDVVFWWAGTPADVTSPVLGYRVALDGAEPTFTTSMTRVFYDLPAGLHQLRVAAVDARLDEDPTPAQVDFEVGLLFRFETEPNVVPGSATTIEAGTEIRGATADALDVDWYELTASPSRGQLSLTFRRPTGGVGTTSVVVYAGDPALNTVVADLTAGPEGDQRATVTTGTGGNAFFVRIQGDALQQPDPLYVLSVAVTALDDAHFRETEPNDAHAESNALVLSDTMPVLRLIGSADATDDMDWYKIAVDVPEPRVLELTLARLGSGETTTLEAFVGPFPGDDRKMARLSASTVNDQFAALPTSIALSELFVRVDGAAAEDVPYAVTLALTPPPTAVTLELEPNGVDPRTNPRAANVLVPGQPLQGSSWDGDDDTDWYAVDVASAGALRVTLSRPHGAGSTAIRLYDASVVLIDDEIASSANRQSTAVAAPVQPGRHYVELDPTGESPLAPYTLVATAEAPGVLSASHSATVPLRLGDRLTVTATAAIGTELSFSIAPLRSGLPMFDDGGHDDGAANDGIFVGTYDVRDGDELRDATIEVRARDASGGDSTLTAARPVTLDSVAPDPVVGVSAGDVPNDDGGVLSVSWEAADAADLARYLVFVTDVPLASAAGQAPAIETTATTARIPVTLDNIDWFVTVAAVDAVGNRSRITSSSVVGPVQTRDNRVPDSVTGVSVADMPGDLGGTLTVRWNGTTAPDFAAYRVYLDEIPILSVSGLAPTKTIRGPLQTLSDVGGLPNGVAFFVVVTVTDGSGNESPLGESSAAGPATPTVDAVPDDSALGLRGPTGVVRSTSAALTWNRLPPTGGDAFDRFVVTLDGGPTQTFTGASTTLQRLTAGPHSVRVSVPERGVVAVHTFEVSPSAIPEEEPNDAEALAQDLSPNLPVVGNADGDADWFRASTRVPGDLALTAVRRGGDVDVTVYRSSSAGLASVRNAHLDAVSTSHTAIIPSWSEDLLVRVLGPGRYELSASVLPTGGTRYEREPNDDADLADTVPLSADGIAWRGSLDTDGDDDWFWWQVPAVTHADVSFYRPAGAGTTTLRIYRGDPEVPTNQVAEVLFVASTLFRSMTMALAPGTYAAAVSADQAHTGAYDFAVRPVVAAQPRETEPNARLADATPIELDQVVLADSWRQDDVDAFRVDVPSAGVLVVHLERTEGIGSTRLRIARVDGTELASAEAFPLTGGIVDAQAQVTLGPYFVLVEASEPSDAPYRLNTVSLSGLSHDAVGVLTGGEDVVATVVWRPGRSVTATVEDGSGNALSAPVTLIDSDGTGHYVGTLTIGANSADGPRRLTTTLSDGDLRATAVFPGQFTADTQPPTVQALSHNARGLLAVDAVVRVEALAEPGLVATVDLLNAEGASVRAKAPFPEDNPGEYVALLTVRSTDHVTDGVLRATFEDAAGNRTTRTIGGAVNIDTRPPAVSDVTHTATTTLIDGDSFTIRARSQIGARVTALILSAAGEVALENIPIFDDGAHDDGDADDGRFGGTYTVQPTDVVPGGVLVVRASDSAGNVAERTASQPITIDAAPPTVARVSHDAASPLPLGAELRVVLDGDPGASAAFDIRTADGASFRENVPLVDDGSRGDEEPGDGTYVGRYTVAPGDNVANATIVARLSKSNGKRTSRGAAVPVTLDGTPPGPVTGAQARDRPDDEGGVIELTWSASTDGDFAQYVVYQSPLPIASLVDRVALDRIITDPAITRMAVDVAFDETSYFAVAVKDSAGNLSTLDLAEGGSTTTAAVAIDNLPPHPIRDVLAVDRPNDAGAALTLVWQPAGEVDFAEYHVYVAEMPFPAGAPGTAAPPVLVVPDRSIGIVDVPTALDEVDLFVAVTALDRSGNESLVGTSSTSGPVRSEANAPPDPDGGIMVLGGPVATARHTSVALRWTRFADDGPIPDYRVRVDGGDLFTTANELLLPDLGRGLHTVIIEPSAGPAGGATRVLQVDPASMAEREPNDGPDLATDLPSGVAVRGALADDSGEDWFRVRLAAAAQIDVHLTRPSAGVAQAEAFAGPRLAQDPPVASLSADGLRSRNTHTSFALAPGDLLVRVLGDPGQYTLAVSQNPVDARFGWDTEPNGEPLRATRVPATVREVAGTANGPADEDWFRFESSVAGPLLWTLDAAQADGAPATQVELFVAGSVSSPSMVASAVISPSRPSITVTTAVRDAILLARVIGAPGAAYSLRSSIVPLLTTATRELEPNDDVARAGPVAQSTPTAGAIWGPGDVDWHRLTGIPGAHDWMALSLRQAELDWDPEVTVLTSGMREIGVLAPDPDDVRLRHLAVPASAGAAYARVRGSANGDYALSAVPIRRAQHDAARPLPEGGLLTVRMGGGPGWMVRAKTNDGRLDLPLSESVAGAYSATHTVQDGDDVTDAVLTLLIETAGGAWARLPLSPTITLDTIPPTLEDVRVEATSALTVGDRLRVTLRTELGSTASFRVESLALRVAADLFDDGDHQDGDPNDGLYGGFYEVRPGDDLQDGTVLVAATDRVGNSAERQAVRRVTFDTTPPSIEAVSHDADEVLHPGDRVLITVVAETGARGTFSIESLRGPTPLVDNGTLADELANDGIYTGTLVVARGDNADNAVVTIELRDNAGNIATVDAPAPISVDTEAPVIIEVTHDATRPLREGDALSVQLTGEPGGEAFFHIGDVVTDAALFDDGSGDDESAGDGIYSGAYVVRTGDDVTAAVVAATLRDRNGNSTTRAAQMRVTLDATPPEPIQGLAAEDVPGDDGNVLAVTWEPVTDARDFLRYQIYRATAPIRSTSGMLPDVTKLPSPQETTWQLTVPANNVGYYIAVTAVDEALNESPLGPSSTAGPAQARDDGRPAAVVGVTADDAPSDQGRAIVVAWTSRNEDEDFARYAIFVDADPLRDTRLPTLEPAASVTDRTVLSTSVPVQENGVPYHVAVAAEDVNGNLSPLTPTSMVRNVVALDNIPPGPVTGVRATDMPSDRGGSLRVRWDAPDDETVASFQVYVSRSPILETTDLTRLAPPTAVQWDPDFSAEATVSTELDEADHYVAVIAIDGGDNRSRVGLDATAGPQRSVPNVLASAAEAVVRAGFDQTTQVRVPAGVARSGIRIDILEVTGTDVEPYVAEANLSLADANIDETVEDQLVDSVRYFHTDEALFAAPVEVTLPVPPLDPIGLKEDVRLFRLNADVRPARWQLVQGSAPISPDAPTVTGDTRRLGVFRVARLQLPRRLDRVVVYPNPFRAGSGTEMTFRNLSREVDVEVYTLDGRFVARLETSASGQASWDGRAENGDIVAGGLYLYVVKSPADRRVGQIVVVR